MKMKMKNKIFKMLIVISGVFGLLLPVAHAQDSEKWAGWTISLGSTTHDINKQGYADAYNVTEAEVDVVTTDGFFSFGYVWGFSASSALNLSYSSLGSAKYGIKGDECSALASALSLCNLPDVSVATYDLTYIHRIALSDDTKIMLRGGLASSALSGTVSALYHYDEGGLLMGAGVDYKNILFEYKLYPIAFGEEIEGTQHEFYSGASVISVGYQF